MMRLKVLCKEAGRMIEPPQVLEIFSCQARSHHEHEITMELQIKLGDKEKYELERTFVVLIRPLENILHKFCGENIPNLFSLEARARVGRNIIKLPIFHVWSVGFM